MLLAYAHNVTESCKLRQLLREVIVRLVVVPALLPQVLVAAR
jgi:hypothetical protein